MSLLVQSVICEHQQYDEYLAEWQAMCRFATVYSVTLIGSGKLIEEGRAIYKCNFTNDNTLIAINSQNWMWKYE